MITHYVIWVCPDCGYWPIHGDDRAPSCPKADNHRFHRKLQIGPMGAFTQPVLMPYRRREEGDD